MANLQQNSRFSQTPVTLDIPRSTFDLSHDHKLTWSGGRMIPLYCTRVLPGDTFDVSTNFIVRMSTPLFPVMDNAFLDVAAYFVPYRLIWDHWEEFCGENKSSYWTQPVEYVEPHLIFPDTGWEQDSVADYFAFPTKVHDVNGGLTCSALPFRAYARIWNDWYRDQNYMAPADCPTGDDDVEGKLASEYTGVDGGRLSAAYGGALLKVAKFHDQFTSCLPSAQKGPAVEVPGSFIGDSSLAPVRAYDNMVNSPVRIGGTSLNPVPLKFGMGLNEDSHSSNYRAVALKGDNSSGYKGSDLYGSDVVDPSSLPSGQNGVFPLNLAAELGSGVQMLVNDIRTAFQIQKFYERLALSGSRYTEILRSMFSVSSPDARLQRSEYLGGFRQAINISQVLQNSASTETGTPLGSTGAYSLTSGSHDTVMKSFVEHGILLIVGYVRTTQGYQQGINRLWSTRTRFDHYWPIFANLGNQPVLKKEIYCPTVTTPLEPGSASPYDEAFGFQEAWYEYRYQPNTISGQFRSNAEGSLDAWHYANDFDGTLGSFVCDEKFLQEPTENIDRTLAVTSSVSDQFIGDFLFKIKATRPLPLYSVPGLVDHH